MRTWSSTSLRSVPSKRSAKAFMSGARIAVRTTRTPDDLSTSSEARAQFRVVVADDNLWYAVHGGVPGLLRAPLVGWRVGHRGVEDRSATQVQEEEYEHPRGTRAGYFLHPHAPRCVTPPFGSRDAGH